MLSACLLLEKLVLFRTSVLFDLFLGGVFFVIPTASLRLDPDMWPSECGGEGGCPLPGACAARFDKERQWAGWSGSGSSPEMSVRADPIPLHCTSGFISPSLSTCRSTWPRGSPPITCILMKEAGGGGGGGGRPCAQKKKKSFRAHGYSFLSQVKIWRSWSKCIIRGWEGGGGATPEKTGRYHR